MTAIEATATVDADHLHLTLDQPLPEVNGGKVKVIVLFEEEIAVQTGRPVDFTKAIGSYYRDFPNAPRMTTEEWMKMTREGEEE